MQLLCLANVGTRQQYHLNFYRNIKDVVSLHTYGKITKLRDRSLVLKH